MFDRSDLKFVSQHFLARFLKVTMRRTIFLMLHVVKTLAPRENPVKIIVNLITLMW